MGGSQNNGEPFAMQELADALQGTKKKLVKKPVNPDLSLWLGGVERLYNAGIEKLG
jgi:chorismate mutase